MTPPPFHSRRPHLTIVHEREVRVASMTLIVVVWTGLLVWGWFLMWVLWKLIMLLVRVLT